VSPLKQRHRFPLSGPPCCVHWSSGLEPAAGSPELSGGEGAAHGHRRGRVPAGAASLAGHSLLAERANAKAAKRFLAKALRRSRRDWNPHIINTRKNPAYGEAVAKLKKKTLLPKDTQHRELKTARRTLLDKPGRMCYNNQSDFPL
jgi:DDE domain